MQVEKKKVILLWITVIFLIVIVFGATYAYFQAQTGLGAQTGVNVTAETTDSLMFEVGEDISIEAGQHNFGEGMDNQSGSTYARAILKSTTDAPYTYNVYLDMKKNGFNYTTEDNKPEIMLKITNPNGEEVTSGIEGVTYTSVVDGLGNTITGFDLTPLNSSNVLKIATNYEIKTTNTITQEWNIEIILINLDSDQSANAGSSLSAKLVARKEEHAGAKGLKRVSYDTTSEIWGHKDTITKIVFEDGAKVYGNAEYTYDLSEAQDKGIMAYMINNGDNTYTTYINSDGKIKAQITNNNTYLFYRFTKLASIKGLENLDVSGLTTMGSMFSGCSRLTTLDLSSWDTSKVTNMSNMFFNCVSLTTLDVGNFDTSKVTNMNSMFQNCSDLTTLDLSNWDTTSVINMSYMFSGCSSLTTLDLSSWDTSSVTNMTNMFSNCNSLTTLDVSKFDTSNVTSMSTMFSNCRSLTTLDVSHFDTSKVIYMDWMFNGCSGLTTLDVSKFDTSQVTTMSRMFQNSSNLISLNLSTFDTSKVTNMSYMFWDCSSLTTLNLSSFDTSQVTDMFYMFNGCSNLTNLDFRNADFTKVTNYGSMFTSVPSTIQVIVKDQAAKDFIQARLTDASNTGSVTIA